MDRQDDGIVRWPEDPAGGIAGTGVRVNVSDQVTLLEELKARLAARRGFRIATLNLDHVVKLRSLPDFAAAYREHTHVTADGNPIVWICRLAGQEVSLVPGSDLVVPITRLAAETGVHVVLLGSSDAVLAGAAQRLGEMCPGLEIAARIAPPMGFDPTGPLAEDYIERLRASGAGLCLVALGAPKQEIFAAHAGRQLPHMGFASIGAGLDFLSGHQIRAPRLARALVLEWAWRLGRNPGRLGGRYAACAAILPRLAVEALRRRRRSGTRG